METWNKQKRTQTINYKHNTTHKHNDRKMKAQHNKTNE